MADTTHRWRTYLAELWVRIPSMSLLVKGSVSSAFTTAEKDPEKTPFTHSGSWQAQMTISFRTSCFARTGPSAPPRYIVNPRRMSARCRYSLEEVGYVRVALKTNLGWLKLRRYSGLPFPCLGHTLFASRCRKILNGYYYTVLTN